MSGHRIFELFGFQLPVRTKETKNDKISEYEQLKFVPDLFLWVNLEIAEKLTVFQPSGELLFNKRINIIKYTLNS